MLDAAGRTSGGKDLDLDLSADVLEHVSKGLTLANVAYQAATGEDPVISGTKAATDAAFAAGAEEIGTAIGAVAGAGPFAPIIGAFAGIAAGYTTDAATWAGNKMTDGLQWYVENANRDQFEMDRQRYPQLQAAQQAAQQAGGQLPGMYLGSEGPIGLYSTADPFYGVLHK